MRISAISNYNYQSNGIKQNSKLPIRVNTFQARLQVPEGRIPVLEDFARLFPKGVKNYSTMEILESIGINCKKDKHGKLIISHYCQPSLLVNFADLGINENRLFQDIKEIEGYANLCDKNLKTLGALERIGGDANFINSRIVKISKLKYIGGNADFCGSQINSLGSIEEIGGSLVIQRSKMTSLGKLKKVGKEMNIGWSKISDLGYLEEVGGSLFIGYTPITSMKNVRKIGGDIDFSCTKVTDIGALEEIGGYADFSGSEITSLRRLRSIGSWADFNGSKIEDIGDLKYIKGVCHADNLVLINRLKVIRDNIGYPDSYLIYIWDECA